MKVLTLDNIWPGMEIFETIADNGQTTERKWRVKGENKLQKDKDGWNIVSGNVKRLIFPIDMPFYRYY